MRRIRVRTIFTGGFAILLGVLAYAVGIHSFLVPNGLIDGGVTGISMLFARTTKIELSWFLVAINLPFIAWGFFQIGRAFGVICAASITGVALMLLALPLPVATSDLLLSAVFGGFFIGAGMGLTIRGGGVLDGTEIFALIVTRRTPFSVGDIILGLNVVIFTIAAFTLGIEPALYSVLAYWSAARTVDFILSGIEEFSGVTIVSEHYQQIKEAIHEELKRGVTLYQGRGGYRNNPIQIVFCVTTRLELPRLRRLVREIDPDAFFTSHGLDDASGGLTHRRLGGYVPH